MRNQEARIISIDKNQFDVINNTEAHYPQLIKFQTSSQQKDKYFSLLCRNGPLPQKYHSQTDFICLILYIILLVGAIILVILNGISGSTLTYENADKMKSDLFFGTKFFLWQNLFSAIAVIAISFFLTLIALYIPKIMSFFSVILLISICILSIVVQIKRYFAKPDKIFLYLFKGLLSLTIMIVIILILLRRKNRIINLGVFLQLSQRIIKPHLCLIYTHMIVLSFIQIAIWYSFASLYYGVASANQNSSKFINFLAKLVIVFLWLWTSGALIAFADYFVTSYTVHWFYTLSKEEQIIEKSALHVQQLGYQAYFKQEGIQKQFVFDQGKQKYSSGVLKPIYKKLWRHIGTILFGSILAYLPLYLISKTQKILFKSSSKQFGIATLSKYGYLDTIMEWQGFIKANHRIYELRKRIKSVMPQFYMLGHIYGDFTKLALILIGLAGVNQLVEFKSDVAIRKQYFLSFIFTQLLFGIGLCLQIATNFTNLIGKCGDIAFFLYCIDIEVQRVHFAHNQNYSTPKSLLQILKTLTIKRNWKLNE